MEDSKAFTTSDKALIGIIPFTLFLSLLLYFITENQNAEVKSLAVGATASLILNFWNNKTIIKIADNDYRKIKIFTTISFFVRYLSMIGIILLGVLVADYNAIYMIFGFFEYPLLIAILGIVSGKENT